MGLIRIEAEDLPQCLREISKGLFEARCLLEDRIPVRYAGKALNAVKTVEDWITGAVDERPVEPVQVSRGTGTCPACGATIRSAENNWCGGCGRKIDWTHAHRAGLPLVDAAEV